jgi:hypothetical protein
MDRTWTPHYLRCHFCNEIIGNFHAISWCCGLICHNECLQLTVHTSNKKLQKQIVSGKKCFVCKKKQTRNPASRNQAVHKFAEEGIVWAIVCLGESYEFGTTKYFTIKQDKYKAREFYSEGARLGDLECVYNFANHCNYGIGGVSLPLTALKWYEIAHKHGNLDATTNWGMMYELGYTDPEHGFIQSSERAAALFQEVVDSTDRDQCYQPQGQGNALFRLARFYVTGNGVKQSFKIARELLKRCVKFPSVAQQNAVELSVLIDKGCSFCFTPFSTVETINLLSSAVTGSMTFSVPQKSGVPRNCKCKVVKYCNDLCTCFTFCYSL